MYENPSDHRMLLRMSMTRIFLMTNSRRVLSVATCLIVGTEVQEIRAYHARPDKRRNSGKSQFLSQSRIQINTMEKLPIKSFSEMHSTTIIPTIPTIPTTASTASTETTATTATTADTQPAENLQSTESRQHIQRPSNRAIKSTGSPQRSIGSNTDAIKDTRKADYLFSFASK